MNIFHIPSWYPSVDNPQYGIFIKEQIHELAKNYPELQFGVSTWGQGDDRHLLWARDHLFNLSKIRKHRKATPSDTIVAENLIEFHTPSLTWSRKILSGNHDNIIKSNLSSYRRFKSRVGKVHIIHAQATYPAAIIAQNLSLLLNVPYVVTTRMSPFPFKEFQSSTGTLKPIILEPLQAASRVIAISQSLESRLNSLDIHRTITIHNLVRDDFFVLPPYKSPEPFTLTFAGRLVPQKGVDVLIRAASLLTNIPITFEIIGSGIEKNNLFKMAKKLGCSNKFNWIDDLNREELREKLWQSNGLILPSRHETFGNVLTEALACGKPVISTKCGGPEDIVNDLNGLLAEVDDSEDLSNKIKELFENYDRYDSHNIREDLINRFSSKKISGQIISCYEDILSNS